MFPRGERRISLRCDLFIRHVDEVGEANWYPSAELRRERTLSYETETCSSMGQCSAVCVCVHADGAPKQKVVEDSGSLQNGKHVLQLVDYAGHVWEEQTVGSARYLEWRQISAPLAMHELVRSAKLSL